MNQSHKDRTSAIVDGLLKFIASGGIVTTALLAPNAVQIFDKPLAKMLNNMDERGRKRELRRVAIYMKSRGLIKYKPRDYEHGIQITKEGRIRLKKSDYDNLAIPTPKKWDKKWRLVFFDIPIDRNKNRQALYLKLRQLNFQPLQKSIWIHPFPCRTEVEVVAQTLGIRKFITYVEISEVDAADQLKVRFKRLLR